MIQGVHAETIAFSPYDQARGYVMARSLASIGIASQFGGREVELRGTQTRPFRVRVTEVHERSKAISCLLELHDVARIYAPLIRVEITCVPEGSRTRLSLKGSASRGLIPSAYAQATGARGLANEYARALLDQIARAIETRFAGDRQPSSPQATPALRKPRTAAEVRSPRRSRALST
jgi:hypothetical protein